MQFKTDNNGNINGIIVTSKELNAQISGDLPNYQRMENLKFIRNACTILKVGGVWIYPNSGESFTKVGDQLWELSKPNSEPTVNIKDLI